MSSRVKGLDGLRGISVLVVVLCHLLLFPQGGFLGVDIFFVLSGYIITRNILLDNYENIKEFYTKRIKKIVPPLLFSVFLILVASFSLKNYLYLQYIKNILSFNLNLIFLKNENSYNLSTISTYSPIAHLWSLAIEEQFYLLAPLIFLLVKQKRSIYVALGFSSISFYFFIINFSEFGNKGNYFSSVSRFWELIFGLTLAIFEVKYNLLYQSYKSKFMGFGSYTFIFSIFLLVTFVKFESNGKIGEILIALVTLALIPLVDNKFFNNSLLTFFGKRSYGIYLYHIPIFYLVLNTRDGYIFKVLSLLITLMFAELSFRFLEGKVIKSKAGFGKVIFIVATSFSLVLGITYFLPKIQTSSTSLQVKSYKSEMSKICNSAYVACGEPDNINSNASWFNCRLSQDYLANEYSRCLAKSSKSKLKVMVLGDSVALSYVPGLVSRGQGYNLYININFGCGWIASDRNDPKLISSNDLKCNNTVKKSIEYVNKVKPDLIILSMSAQQVYNIAYLGKFGDSNEYLAAERKRIFSYYEKYLNLIEKSSKKVLIILPPKYLESKNCQHPKNSFDLCQDFFKDPNKSLYYQEENKRLLGELVAKHPEVYLDNAEIPTCLPSFKNCLWENPLGQTRAAQVHLTFWLSFIFGDYLNKTILGIL